MGIMLYINTTKTLIEECIISCMLATHLQMCTDMILYIKLINQMNLLYNNDMAEVYTSYYSK